MNKRKPVKSLSQFIKEVEIISQKWADDFGEYIYPWFRGHNNGSYNLLPSILRNDKHLANEDSYRQDFMFKAHPFLDQSYYKPTNDSEWYFLMQHYGIPTRLLDWSEGCLIALHFAVSNEIENENPCVWVLNPFELNNYFHKKDILFSDEDILRKYNPKPWSKQKLPSNPIAIQPQINSKRIASQKGCFLLFGDKKIDLSKLKGSESFLIKIEIDFNHVESIKDSLTLTGLTESILFPELNGLAREIINYYRY